MLALPPSERNDIYTLVPNNWICELNRALGVQTPAMSFYLADHLHMFDSSVREHFDRILNVEMELAPLAVLLRTVRHKVVNRLATDDKTRTCGNYGGVICVFQGTGCW